MSKQVYISADYDSNDGDQEVVELLNSWGQDDKHKVDFIDMSKVSSGTVANSPDCRICDLKAEFNRQINASSAVIFIVGNHTASRTAGSTCQRAIKSQYECTCTPYKNNANGARLCKVGSTSTPGENDDYGSINPCSYLEHEFRQAAKKGKHIIIFYNSTRNESTWLPDYMNAYADIAVPFWIKDDKGRYKGDYEFIKKALGYE